MKRYPFQSGLFALAATIVVSGCGGGGGASLYESTTGTGGSSGSAGGSTAGGGISNVSTGVPTQRTLSLSVEKYALNWSLDGDTTTVTARVTDTAGNPVPEGTAVQFSTEGGQIQTSCKLTGVASGSANISACSVTFATQNLRPQDGLVTILAWLEGQEAYIDLNGNGSYDSGEPFYDTGRIYRDDDTNAGYNAGVDELNVGGTVASAPGLGSSACGVNNGSGTTTYTASSFGFEAASLDRYYLGTVPASVDNTCDGAWGRTLVRGSVVLPVSYPPFATQIEALSGGQFVLFSQTSATSSPVSAPAGTTVEIFGALPAGCTAEVNPATVASNQVAPTLHQINASGTCGSALSVRATFGDYSTNPVSIPL